MQSSEGQSGKPNQNGFIECFNKGFRGERQSWKTPVLNRVLDGAAEVATWLSFSLD
jgi:hypothetical protein